MQHSLKNLLLGGGAGTPLDVQEIDGHYEPMDYDLALLALFSILGAQKRGENHGREESTKDHNPRVLDVRPSL